LKTSIFKLFTIGLLLLTASAHAKLPSAYAGTLVQLEPCDSLINADCKNTVFIELISINQTGIRLTQINYPNGTTANTTYDGAGRTQSITNLQDAALISSFEYILDDNGNRVQQTETQGALVEVTAYDYDLNDRLIETLITVAGTEVEKTNFTYDLNYNRLTEVKTLAGQVSVNKSFDYNVRGQVTDVFDNLDNANNAVYLYDNNGNRIQKTQGTLVETYLYDVRDQLKEIQQGGSTIGQFLYDYQGLRIEKTTTDNTDTTPGSTPVTDTKKYVYDDQSVLMQTDASGTTLSKYDYGSNRLLSMNNITEGAQFYLFDALGSPVNLTKTDGTVQARYQYDAFGNARSQTGDSANVFGFTGHEKDEETGLYYFKARYYDPTLGQFLTQDAFEGMTDLPPSLHKYIYAYGNPTYFTDPDGNEATPFFHTEVNRNTDILKTQGSIDTGNYAKDIALAMVYSGENLLRTGVNIASAGLNSGTFAYSAATGQSFERAEQDLFAMSVSTPTPAAMLYSLATLRPLRMMNKINKLSNVVEQAPITRKLDDAFDISTEVAPPQSSNLPMIVKESSDGVDVKLLPSSTKPDFYVGSAGPEATLPSTGYRYMDSSFAERTINSGEAPLSYFGFEKFESGSKARDRFQIFYEEGNPESWSDARLRGEFDTLQLFDKKGVPNVRVPMEAGDRGKIPEPITRYYPEYGQGGQQQLVPKERTTVKFDEIKIMPEEEL
jgi:RHS repeat-associated protein